MWNDMTLNHLKATKSVEAVESMNEQARRFFLGGGGHIYLLSTTVVLVRNSTRS